MKKNIVLIILFFVFQQTFSQISDCSKCNSTIYSKEDISHLSLLELNVFRNEIFARHQYVFKDDRLENYFLEKYDWYKPNYKSKKTIVLNEIEKKNVSLLLQYENKKKALKKTIIQELEKFKLALNKNETDNINSVINNVAQDFSTDHKKGLKLELKNIFSKIQISGMHWYNEKALYKITKDDGFFLNETSISIEGNTIVLSYNDIGYSELLSSETAFSFGSDYESVNEYASWYTFEIRNKKLILINHQAAG